MSMPSSPRDLIAGSRIAGEADRLTIPRAIMGVLLQAAFIAAGFVTLLF